MSMRVAGVKTPALAPRRGPHGGGWRRLGSSAASIDRVGVRRLQRQASPRCDGVLNTRESCTSAAARSSALAETGSPAAASAFREAAASFSTSDHFCYFSCAAARFRRHGRAARRLL